MFELEHFAFDRPGQRLVDLVQLRHDPLLGGLAGIVDDVCSFARAAHGQSSSPVAGGDALLQQLVEHGDGIGRNRTHRCHPVHDLGLDRRRQRAQHFCRHVGIKLQQQHGNRLRMFVFDQRQQSLGIQPARQLNRRFGLLGIGRDPVHQVLRLHRTDRLIEQAVESLLAITFANAIAVSMGDKARDRIPDQRRSDFPEGTHLFAQNLKFRRIKAGQQSSSLGFVKQHYHHRCPFGVAKRDAHG